MPRIKVVLTNVSVALALAGASFAGSGATAAAEPQVSQTSAIQAYDDPAKLFSSWPECRAWIERMAYSGYPNMFCSEALFNQIGAWFEGENPPPIYAR